ncbi:MAG: hypothetical protein RL085_1055 [Actinomycetota bacterium]|jgi:hypothetical protein
MPSSKRKNPLRNCLAIVGLSVVFGIGAGLWAGLSESQNSPSQLDSNIPQEDQLATTHCEVAMQLASEAVGDEGEMLLKETGNVCGSKREWDAALRKFPRAIGGASVDYLDGTEFDLVCRTYPELTMCSN